MKNETKHGTFQATIEEYYSKEKGVIYYHWRALMPGFLFKWRKIKTKESKMPNVDYDAINAGEKERSIRKVINILEETLSN